MLLEFTKMNGAGNDFVLMDNRRQSFTLSKEQVVKLCDRHRGIGADGVLMLIPSASGKADWAWEFFNSDGSTGEMCGNGARCFAKFVQRASGSSGAFTFETGAGIVRADVEGSEVAVTLTKPGRLRLNEVVHVASGKLTVHSLDTGVPHAVMFVPDADKVLVEGVGREIRNHAYFLPRGTNVNFVQVTGPNAIRVRTFERGVEGETLACGTGVTAAALVSSRVHKMVSPVRVQVQGGEELKVSWVDANGEFADVRLTGPAEFVFEGKMEV